MSDSWIYKVTDVVFPGSGWLREWIQNKVNPKDFPPPKYSNPVSDWLNKVGLGFNLDICGCGFLCGAVEDVLTLFFGWAGFMFGLLLTLALVGGGAYAYNNPGTIARAAVLL